MDSKTLNISRWLIVAVRLAASALFAGFGWLAYRTNLDSFSRFQEAGYSLRNFEEPSVSFYRDRDGQCHPATLLQAGSTQFLVAFQLLGVAIGVLFWRRRPVISPRTSDGSVSDDAAA